MLGAFVEHDVVDGDVQGVLGERRLDLVRLTDQGFRALELFVHLLDARLRGGTAALFGLGVGLGHFVVDDLAVDLDGHGHLGSF